MRVRYQDSIIDGQVVGMVAEWLSARCESIGAGSRWKKRTKVLRLNFERRLCRETDWRRSSWTVAAFELNVCKIQILSLQCKYSTKKV